MTSQTAKLPKFNIAPASDYAAGAEGFVIEALGFWNTDHEHYAIPAWDERGLPHLAGPFATRAAAHAALIAA